MSMHIYGLLSEADIAPDALLALIEEKGEGGAASELLRNADWNPCFRKEDSVCLDASDRILMNLVTLPDGGKGVFHILWEAEDKSRTVIVDVPEHRPDHGYLFLGVRRDKESVALTYTDQNVLEEIWSLDDRSKDTHMLMSGTAVFNLDAKGNLCRTSNYGFGTNIRSAGQCDIRNYFRNLSDGDPHAAYLKKALDCVCPSGSKIYHLEFTQVALANFEDGL